MVYATLQSYDEFKADIHRISIRARKDPAQKWYDLPYLAIDDAIDEVLDKWSVEWCYHGLGGGWKQVYYTEEEGGGQAEDGTASRKRKKEAVEKAQAEQTGKEEGKKQVA